MNIEVADTIVATMVATTATRKMAGSKAEPDPVPLLNVEDMKTATAEKSAAAIDASSRGIGPPSRLSNAAASRLSRAQVASAPTSPETGNCELIHLHFFLDNVVFQNK
jgi:hypothetical protein